MRRKAFSLAEILVSLSILLLVFALGVLSMRRQSQAANSRALADLLAEELRGARARAISQQTPVALIFPSQGGTTAVAQSLAILEGESWPRITRVVDFRGDVPAGRVFLGSWGLGAGHSLKLGAAPGGANSADFPVATWLPAAQQKDYAFIFTPAGTLVSNDLPTFDNEYHILATTGVDAAASAPPPGTPTMATPPSYFQASRVGLPVTLAISPAGAVRIIDGLAGADASVNVVQGSFDSPRAAAASLLVGANHNPEITRVELLPKPQPDLLAVGVDANIARDGLVTLQVYARDVDGDPLQCEWSCTPPAGAQPGAFSVKTAGRSLARWQPSDDRWVATWEWQPPYQAKVGEHYRLSCTVRDDRGGSDSAGGTAVKNIEIVERGQVVYVSDNIDICRINANGSGQRRLTRLPSTNFAPTFAPDGTRVIFSSKQSGYFNLYLMNSDGSGLRRLTNHPGNDTEPFFTKDGTSIFYLNCPDSGPPWSINKLSLSNPAASTVIVPNLGFDAHLALSPDEKWLAYDCNSVGLLDVYLINASGVGPPRNLTNSPPGVKNLFPMFTRDGNGLVFLSKTGASQWNLHGLDLTLASPAVVPISPADPAAKLDPGFSPGGSQMIYTRRVGVDNALYIADFTDAVHPLSNPRRLTVSPGHSHTHAQWRP